MIRFVARESHYARHLAPIAAVLGRPVEPLINRIRTTDTVVVAAHNDLVRVEAPSIVLVEHGAGQTYLPAPGQPAHASYSGGDGRGRVALFVCPSQTVAGRNLANYPTAQAAVVGCPALDRHHLNPSDPEPDLAVISFHYDEPQWPESRSTMRHYGPGLSTVRADLETADVRLAGHAHPRIADEMRFLCRRAGIEWIADIDEVLARAAVYACDNSSTLPEAASVGIPLVWLNAPWYRRDVEHGGRFWQWPQGQVQVDGPEGLAAGIVAAFTDPPAVRMAREKMVASVYAHTDGHASQRAAAAIAALAAENEAA